MTTPNPATLREALDEAPELVDYEPTNELGTVVAAARWALDLIEGGKEVWWCETHQRASHLAFCCNFGNMVKRLLVTP